MPTSTHEHSLTPTSEESRFPLDLTGVFLSKYLIQFSAKMMQDFGNFVLQYCIVIFYAEQVYSKPLITNFTI